MLKIGQNWGKIANCPPNAQQKFAPLVFQFLLASSRTTITNNNLDNQGAGRLNSIFANQFNVKSGILF